MSEQYIELHARSAFSFLEGASLPEELIAESDSSAMALLDRDGVYGAPRFHLAAKKTGIRALIGAEIKVDLSSLETPDDRQDATSRRSVERRLNSSAAGGTENKNLVTLPLLVKNRTGYQNLCRLITQMKMRVPKNTPSSVTLDELEHHAKGLICLTGDNDGPLAWALGSGAFKNRTAGSYSQAQKISDWLIRVFGRGEVYAELQRHFNREEEARNQAVIEVARTFDLPLLATNGVCYARKNERQIADVFTSLRNHVKLDTAGKLLAQNSERYIKTPAAMSGLFSDLPEAIANTLELSSKLQFTLEDLGYEFPCYPAPAGETMASFLWKRTMEGARQRYTGKNGTPSFDRARQQIEYELKLIEKLKLEGYFLIVWDIVEFCRKQNILVQGRGSAANSAVCYSLGITAVDPVGMGLLFERFLSEERGEWPDIDLDLPSGDQREKAIQYVYERYGKLGAAMTANVITYRGRSAAREVGKALGFDEDTLSRLSSLVRTWEYHDPKDTPARQFKDAGLNVQDPRIKKFFELFLAVQDLPRHLGQHSGGMVICQGQLDSVVPLEPATMPGRVVVQWDKEDCADLGIVKVDLLGLGMMAVLEDSIQLIRDHYYEEVDLAHLPSDDPEVYKALQKADTIGMFQVESRAQMSSLPRLRPEKFYDLVVQVAIIRPGPIVGNMVHPYLKRRQGREKPRYAHPALEPVLKRTLGVPLFQEQLLRMAMICAGFTGGEAEELRRAFGFKRSERRMSEVEVKLRQGMERNGITGKIQDEVIQSITSFALYGFPESHAASFALLAYASAYLKCHYLAAFTAATLNNQPMGFYQPFTIIKDAQRHGLKVLPIDVTCSDWLCTIEQWSVVGGQWPEEQWSVVGGRWSEEQWSVVSGQWPERQGSVVGGQRPEEQRSVVSGQWPERQGSVVSGQRPEEQRSVVGGQWPESPPPNSHPVRLGLRYAKGLREEAGRAIVRAREQRPFSSIEDLHRRVPELRKDELRKLAQIGALNFIGSTNLSLSDSGRALSDTADRNHSRDALLKGSTNLSLSDSQTSHRREALWQTELVSRPVGPLHLSSENSANDFNESNVEDSCLEPMNIFERLDADFRGTGITLGKHPVAYYREELNRLGVTKANELHRIRHGTEARIAGWVIVRQRPGTAKGFVFLSIEDETGISNAIITPDIFEQYRMVLIDHPFLLIEGVLQNQDNVISVKANRVEALHYNISGAASHDFH